MFLQDQLDFHARRRRRHKSRLRAEQGFREALLDLKPGDVAIDCGANVGTLTRLLAMTGATVHAFEPDPVAFEQLKAHTASLPNVVLHQAAVGVTAGEVFLRRSKDFGDDPVGRTIASSVVEGSAELGDHETVRVEQIAFPDFLRGFERVAVLKIDIEGAEVTLIEAMIAQGLTARVGRAFVETHEKRYPNLRARTLALVRHARKALPTWNMDWI